MERMPADRRRYPRFPLELDVIWTTGQRSFDVHSRDLSVGGVFLMTASPAPVGTVVALVLHIPSSPPQEVALEGRVAHSLAGVGMGVEFVDPPREAREALEACIATATGRSRSEGSASAPVLQPADRRSHPRSAWRTEINLASGSNFYSGLTDDISAGGVFVATQTPLAIGAEVELEFSLPDGGAPIRVGGVVRWLRERKGSAGPDPGMGIKFESLDGTSRARIETFVALRRSELFEDE
jgi:uncharacterized protein (TIGR02266 family)